LEQVAARHVARDVLNAFQAGDDIERTVGKRKASHVACDKGGLFAVPSPSFVHRAFVDIQSGNGLARATQRRAPPHPAGHIEHVFIFAEAAEPSLAPLEIQPIRAAPIADPGEPPIFPAQHESVLKVGVRAPGHD
jgi:hypothetical protein